MTTKEIATVEYTSLKSEQVSRIGFRDNLLYVTLIAIAGTLSITHSAQNHTFLLLVPAVSVILGWTYLMNDTMISAIGRYIREHKALPMGWENDHPLDKRRNSRKVIQLFIDLFTFCGSGYVSLVAYWITPGTHPEILTVASIGEALILAVIAQQFITYASDSIPLFDRKEE